MSWLRIDDGFASHHKVEGLSDAAFRIHVRGMCHAARFGTDGVVGAVMLERWAGRRATAIASELLQSGVWELVDRESEPGLAVAYVIHDYLEYNPTRAEADAEKAARTEQRRLAGKASGVARRERAVNGSANETRTGRSLSVHSPLNPVPSRPVPSPILPFGQDPAPSGAAAPPLENEPCLPGEAVQLVALKVGWRRLGKGDIETLEAWEDRHGTEALTGWVNECVRDGFEPFPSKLRAYLPQQQLPNRRNNGHDVPTDAEWLAYEQNTPG